MKMRHAAAGAGELWWVARVGVQQMLDHSGPSVVHGGTGRCLDCFQIAAATAAESGEDHLQQRGYFMRDFSLDRFGCFFSKGAGSCSGRGRRRQMAALTSTNSRLSCCHFRYSPVSRSALRLAASVGNDSVMVFPFTLNVRRKFGPWPLS